jgi:hypothetical protein
VATRNCISGSLMEASCRWVYTWRIQGFRFSELPVNDVGLAALYRASVGERNVALASLCSNVAAVADSDSSIATSWALRLLMIIC